MTAAHLPALVQLLPSTYSLPQQNRKLSSQVLSCPELFFPSRLITVSSLPMKSYPSIKASQVLGHILLFLEAFLDLSNLWSSLSPLNLPVTEHILYHLTIIFHFASSGLWEETLDFPQLLHFLLYLPSQHLKHRRYLTSK